MVVEGVWQVAHPRHATTKGLAHGVARGLDPWKNLAAAPSCLRQPTLEACLGSLFVWGLLALVGLPFEPCTLLLSMPCTASAYWQEECRWLVAASMRCPAGMPPGQALPMLAHLVPLAPPACNHGSRHPHVSKALVCFHKPRSACLCLSHTSRAVPWCTLPGPLVLHRQRWHTRCSSLPSAAGVAFACGGLGFLVVDVRCTSQGRRALVLLPSMGLASGSHAVAAVLASTLSHCIAASWWPAKVWLSW